MRICFREGMVSLIKKLRVLFVCFALEAGVLLGVPMRPEEIQEVMHQMNQPKMAHVLPGEHGEGDDQLPKSCQ